MSKLRAYAPIFIKRIAWNRKHLDTSVNPEKFPEALLENLFSSESHSGVLDLGCGTGNLRAALRLRGWNGRYIGVDISEQAIDTARKLEDNNAEWHVSAIEDFPFPNQKVSIICICESIYYVELGHVPALIERCRNSLVHGGRIVIRIVHATRHREYIKLLSGLGARSNPPVYTIN